VSKAFLTTLRYLFRARPNPPIKKNSLSAERPADNPSQFHLRNKKGPDLPGTDAAGQEMCEAAFSPKKNAQLKKIIT